MRIVRVIYASARRAVCANKNEEVLCVYRPQAPCFTTRAHNHVQIDCASLARIRKLGPVKVREFVSFMR